MSVALSISLLGVVICSPFNVSAAGNLAYSIGCDYGPNNIDTTPIVRKSCDYYALTGYTSRYNMNPDINDPVATYNGVKKIEADIVMMTGHGNPGGMYFNSKNQGGKYDFWITDNTAAPSGNIILQNYNMNNVKLMIFNGCSTAQGNSNVCKTVVDRGCKASIGWSENISTCCSEKWLNYFNNYLATGNTIAKAAQIANSFSYCHTSIKNYKIYGDSSQVLKRSRTAVQTGEINVITLNQTLSSDKLTDKTAISNILLSAYPDFPFYDFKIDLAMQEDGSGTITVVEKIGDYYSDNAYVLFYDGSKITEVFDRVESPIDRTVYSEDYFNLPPVDLEQIYTMACENVNDEYIIEKQEAEAKINTITGERYYSIRTTISINGAKSVLPYKYTIQ